MKKIIDGKMYDTEVATKMGEQYFTWQEKLYRTAEGVYFLVGEKYSPVAHKTWGDIADILEILSADKALEWLQDSDASQEEITRLFPILETIDI